MGRDCNGIGVNIQYKDRTCNPLYVIFVKPLCIRLHGMTHPASMGTTFCPYPS